jgi:uncharacterized membrane protein required for colicin V production
MGLDVALGVVILIAAIRGWLQGFFHQAVRIGGLIACVYLADPVRSQVKPYVLPYLPKIEPNRVDQLLWWISAGITYAVLVGAATLAFKMMKRPEIPGIPPQQKRNDQFAGFLLGIAKGALIAAFLTAGFQNYALKQVENIPWADGQIKSSSALEWNARYHPARRIWSSVPVQHFVNRIQRMGLQGAAEPLPSEAVDGAKDRPPVQTARRTTEERASQPANGDDPDSGPPAPPVSPVSKGETPDPEPERSVDASKATVGGTSKPK